MGRWRLWQEFWWRRQQALVKGVILASCEIRVGLFQEENITVGLFIVDVLS